MSYLPPDWTEERLRKAVVDDLRQLPSDTLHKLSPHIIEDNEATAMVVHAKIAENSRAERERLGLPPVPFPSPAAPGGDPDQFVQVVEDARYVDFVVIVFRIDYTDEARWERWQKEFDTLLERSMDGRGGAERVRDRLLAPLVDDEQLHGASWGGVTGYFEDCQNNGMVPPGLDLSMCLVVDDEAMASSVDPLPDEEPWVWAVDIHFPFQGPRTEYTGDEIEYPGFFKVAISSLVPDLYPMLAGPRLTGPELWQGGKSIWKHAF